MAVRAWLIVAVNGSAVPLALVVLSVRTFARSAPEKSPPTASFFTGTAKAIVMSVSASVTVRLPSGSNAGSGTSSLVTVSVARDPFALRA